MGRIIWIEGTSIEAGLGASFAWPLRCLYRGDYIVRDAAVASRTIADNVNNTSGTTNSITHNVQAAGGVIALYGPTGGANVCVVVGGGNTNGAYFGVDGPTDYANFVTLLGILKAALPLADIVATEPIPRGDTNWSGSPVWASVWGSSSVGPNQALADWTMRVRANWQDIGLARPPVNLNPIGRLNSPDTNALFQDGAHPTTAGHVYMGAEWELSRAWAP